MKIKDLDSYLWDKAAGLADDAMLKFRVQGNMGTVALFYEETTADKDGRVFILGEMDAAPVGSFNAGIPAIRGAYTRDQMARMFYDAMRRLPILPLEDRPAVKP